MRLASTQILGFAPTGEPILPASHVSQDMDVIRREKLSWDEITIKAAKVVSFIGMYYTEHVFVNQSDFA